MNTILKSNERVQVKEYIPAVMINTEGESLEKNLNRVPQPLDYATVTSKNINRAPRPNLSDSMTRNVQLALNEL